MTPDLKEFLKGLININLSKRNGEEITDTTEKEQSEIVNQIVKEIFEGYGPEIHKKYESELAQIEWFRNSIFSEAEKIKALVSQREEKIANLKAIAENAAANEQKLKELGENVTALIDWKKTNTQTTDELLDQQQIIIEEVSKKLNNINGIPATVNDSTITEIQEKIDNIERELKTKNLSSIEKVQEKEEANKLRYIDLSAKIKWLVTQKEVSAQREDQIEKSIFNLMEKLKTVNIEDDHIKKITEINISKFKDDYSSSIENMSLLLESFNQRLKTIETELKEYNKIIPRIENLENKPEKDISTDMLNVTMLASETADAVKIMSTEFKDIRKLISSMKEDFKVLDITQDNLKSLYLKFEQKIPDKIEKQVESFTKKLADIVAPTIMTTIQEYHKRELALALKEVEVTFTKDMKNHLNAAKESLSELTSSNVIKMFAEHKKELKNDIDLALNQTDLHTAETAKDLFDNQANLTIKMTNLTKCMEAAFKLIHTNMPLFKLDKVIETFTKELEELSETVKDTPAVKTDKQKFPKIINSVDDVFQLGVSEEIKKNIKTNPLFPKRK